VVTGIGLDPAWVVVGAAAEHVLIHYRDAEDLAEEVNHLLGPGQAAQVAMMTMRSKQ